MMRLLGLRRSALLSRSLLLTSLLLTSLLLGQTTLRAGTLTLGETLTLPNADFEKGGEGWAVTEKVPMSEFTGVAAHAGKLGLHIADNDEKYASSALSAFLPAVPGQGFCLTFWARSAVDGAAGVSLLFKNAGLRNISEYQPATVIGKSDGWSQYQLLARAPLTSSSARILIHSFSSAKTVVDLDDLSLKSASGSAIANLPVPVPDAAGAAAHVRRSAPYVILKLDDLVRAHNRVYGQWKKIGDLVRDRNIKATIGIIANSLEGDKPEYFNWIKEQKAGGRVEFWCHGYDHKQWKEGEADLWEFKGTSYDQQKQHLARSQQLAREKLGFGFVTFGAPFNCTDANTVKALSEDQDFKIWLYADAQDAAGKVDLNRVGEVNIENPLFRPNVEKFIAGYNRYPDRDYFVIQGHPQQWDDARFDQFVKVVDFLIEQKAVFTTASEYVDLKNSTPVPPLAVRP